MSEFGAMTMPEHVAMPALSKSSAPEGPTCPEYGFQKSGAPCWESPQDPTIRMII